MTPSDFQGRRIQPLCHPSGRPPRVTGADNGAVPVKGTSAPRSRPQRRPLPGWFPYVLSLALTVLVAFSYVHLLKDDPPWGHDWRDGQIALGMMIGALATIDSIALLMRRQLSLPALTWISILAFAGVVLALTCWMLLIVRTVS